MYNRYKGNTGRFERMDDPAPMVRKPLPERRQALPPVNNQEPAIKRPPPSKGGGLGSILPFRSLQNGLGSILPFGSLQNGLGGLLPKVLPDGLETEDLLLMLVLYLMYKESGDKELLIILGAMFIL